MISAKFALTIGLAFMAGFASPGHAQNLKEPGSIGGATSSDEVNVRPSLEVEMARRKASEKANADAVKAHKLDLVKPGIKSAQALMQSQKYPEALATLASLDGLAQKTPEETYLIERTRVAIASLVNDDALLVKSLEAAFATGQVPAAERVEFSDILARKYFNQKNFPKAIAWSTRYFEAGGKDPAMRRARALSYYLSNDFPRARDEVGADIQAEEKAGMKPTEEQLRLLASCAQKMDDKVAYASAMEKYAAYYPGKK